MPQPPKNPSGKPTEQTEAVSPVDKARSEIDSTLKLETRIIDNNGALYLLRDYANVTRGHSAFIDAFKIESLTEEKLWEYLKQSPALTFDEYLDDRNQRYSAFHTLQVTEDEAKDVSIKEAIKKVDVLAGEINKSISEEDLEALKAKIKEMSELITSLPIGDIPDWVRI